MHRSIDPLKMLRTNVEQPARARSENQSHKNAGESIEKGEYFLVNAPYSVREFG
jgi:hypothetical protein